MSIGKRVFANYYFRTKFGQNVKAAAYIEELKAEAMKLTITTISKPSKTK
jgi:hypothetical protein